LRSPQLLDEIALRPSQAGLHHAQRHDPAIGSGKPSLGRSRELEQAAGGERLAACFVELDGPELDQRLLEGAVDLGHSNSDCWGHLFGKRGRTVPEGGARCVHGEPSRLPVELAGYLCLTGGHHDACLARS
jgi:hypothetical protein